MHDGRLLHLNNCPPPLPANDPITRTFWQKIFRGARSSKKEKANETLSWPQTTTRVLRGIGFGPTPSKSYDMTARMLNCTTLSFWFGVITSLFWRGSY